MIMFPWRIALHFYDVFIIFIQVQHIPYTKMPKTLTKPIKVVYPPGCKEVSDELGKDELVKRLKVME